MLRDGKEASTRWYAPARCPLALFTRTTETELFQCLYHRCNIPCINGAIVSLAIPDKELITLCSGSGPNLEFGWIAGTKAVCTKIIPHQCSHPWLSSGQMSACVDLGSGLSCAIDACALRRAEPHLRTVPGSNPRDCSTIMSQTDGVFVDANRYRCHHLVSRPASERGRSGCLRNMSGSSTDRDWRFR